MLREELLFTRFKGKSVLLDSNLLLVFLTGSLGPRVFERFKRISSYSMDDYDLLVSFVACFSTLLTTPHILTEVSNLANSLPSWYKPEWYEKLAALIRCQNVAIQVHEKWIPAFELACFPEFSEFGITDSAVAKLCCESLVVTEDYRLSGVLQSRNIPVINYCDLRNFHRND